MKFSPEMSCRIRIYPKGYIQSLPQGAKEKEENKGGHPLYFIEEATLVI